MNYISGVNSVSDPNNEQRKNNTANQPKINIAHNNKYPTQLKRSAIDISEKTQLENHNIFTPTNNNIPRNNSKKYLLNTQNTNTLLASNMTKDGFRKTKSKYVQNLMSDTNVKKYKQICIGLIKNDNELMSLYLECGYEKANYSYENFIEKNFFNDKVFLYKLEMLLINNDGNFIKKNYKEKFFKNEISKFLNNKILEQKYQCSIKKMKDKFEEQFMFIKGFELI